MSIKARVLASALTLSAAAFSGWKAHESFRPDPYIPTAGDVPTIGYGSTRYEDGIRVTLSDGPISEERAAELARKLLEADERALRRSLPGVYLHQYEYDAYVDFIGQYGIGNWLSSSMRRELLEGNHKAACDALLRWRYQGGRDCSLPENSGPQGCKGVWTRQQERHSKCLGNI